MKDTERLERVLASHGLAFAALLDAEGSVVARAGDEEAFAQGGLISALLGPYGSAKATFDSLDGQILPRVWAQGDDFALVDKPLSELAVVVFGRDSDDMTDKLDFSTRVAKTIAEEFQGR